MYIRYRSLDRRHVDRDITVMRYRLSIKSSRLSGAFKNGKRLLPQFFASVIETAEEKEQEKGHGRKV